MGEKYDCLVSKMVFLYFFATLHFMRIVLQKVHSASVSVDQKQIGAINQGYLLLVCVMQGDTEDQIDALTKKVVDLRLFTGKNGKINDLSILDIQGDILVVSQFTLAGDLQKGNRPDFTAAADPETAKHLYQQFVEKLLALGVTNVQTGEFGAYMQIELINDGPVTLNFDQ